MRGLSNALSAVQGMLHPAPLSQVNDAMCHVWIIANLMFQQLWRDAVFFFLFRMFSSFFEFHVSISFYFISVSEHDKFGCMCARTHTHKHKYTIWRKINWAFLTSLYFQVFSFYIFYSLNQTLFVTAHFCKCFTIFCSRAIDTGLISSPGGN